MKLSMSFKDVCGMLKKQGPQEAKLLEATDLLLGTALLCSPAVFGPAALAALPTLAVKNELTKLGKWVFDFLMRRKSTDYLERHEIMQTAYALLVFTAFFAALDTHLPPPLRKRLQQAAARQDLVIKAMQEAGRSDIEAPDSPLANIAIAFPHPTATMTQTATELAPLWSQMGAAFFEFCEQLDLWREMAKDEREKIIKLLKTIDAESGKHFIAQYFELCRKYGDFAVWANLQSHEAARAEIAHLSDYFKSYAEMSGGDRIDVGFRGLSELVLKLPQAIRRGEAREMADNLRKSYESKLDQPVIEDKGSISFPTVADAFVPQSFRVLRYRAQSHKLEDDANWDGAPRRDDLGPFLLSYLSSPYSAEAPMLILGHPGSGKSLLTQVLAAQLMSGQFTVIRVPLRDVAADADIPTQIEQGIKKITGVGIDSWVRLSGEFADCPPLVILDGYDELLQASGQVFASYIRDAQRFQEQQAGLGRPLRIVITSRITLIDKAAIPDGATVVRLLEFNRAQRDRWSLTWNRENAHHFATAGIEPFALPEADEPGSEKILALAQQPLLLLMLAIYDSNGNELRKSRGLDRTRLYDSLLRRFIVRELSKDTRFEAEPAKLRNEAVDREMKRLGVAALGMFNRRELYILSPQLDEDLAFFRLQRGAPSGPGRALGEADLLFGSFFFIHKSASRSDVGDEEPHEDAAAFEFLHNTFGEFLTADFILRRVVEQVEALQALRKSSALANALETMLGTADGLDLYWFASLIYTPLFTRPVVMEMIREWAPHVLRARKLAPGPFVDSIETLALNQLSRLVGKREMPSILRTDTPQEGLRVPYGERPLISYVAVYGINLVLLRIVLGPGEFTFDERALATQEEENRPWDRLIHIWQSWFSPLNLAGLNAIMRSRRNKGKITVAAMPEFEEGQAPDRLAQCVNIARALGDDTGYAMAGLLALESSRATLADIDELESRADAEKLTLDLPLAIKRLQIMAKDPRTPFRELLEVGEQALIGARGRERVGEFEEVALLFARALDRMDERYRESFAPWNNQDFQRIRVRDWLSPAAAVDLALYDPGVGRAIWRVSKISVPNVWLIEFVERLGHELGYRALRTGSASWNELLLDIMSSGWGDRLNRVSERFFDLREGYERMDPERAVTYLETAEVLGQLEPLIHMIRTHHGQSKLSHMFDPEMVRELIRRDRFRGLNHLGLLWRLGASDETGGLRRDLLPLIEAHFQPAALFAYLEKYPQRVSSLLQLMREAGGMEFRRRASRRDWDDEWRQAWEDETESDWSRSRLRQNPLLFAMWLSYARLIDSEKLGQELGRLLMFWHDRPGVEVAQAIAGMPVASLSDLRWVAHVSNDMHVQSFVAGLIEGL